jgi:aldose 1-epimerase
MHRRPETFGVASRPLPGEATPNEEAKMSDPVLEAGAAAGLLTGTRRPASLGWHPWWARRLARGGELEVDLRAGAMYRRDEEGIAVDELVPIPLHPWDDCFTELGDPPAVLRWPGAVTVTLETDCPCLVVFDEPQHAICVEPQTHPPDALNLGPSVVAAGHPLTASCSWRWDLAGWTE